jgi:hypothetical protein
MTFSTHQNVEKCSPEAMYSSDNGLMTLVVYRFLAAKTNNRGCANARYLWFEGLMTLSESHFQAIKMPNSNETKAG